MKHEVLNNMINFDKNIDYTGKVSFLVGDIIGFMKSLNMDDGTYIMNIYNYSGDESDFEQVKKMIDDHKDSACIICTTACASMIEFPESDYTLDTIDEPNKKLVPLDVVIPRETERLESCGFVDFNFYTQYENQRAMIYPNELGLEILEAAKECRTDNK